MIKKLNLLLETIELENKYKINGVVPNQQQYRVLENKINEIIDVLNEPRKVEGTETIQMEDGLQHDVDTNDYSYHMPNCKYCITRKAITQ